MYILPTVAAAASWANNVLISNDDGWAEMNIRQLSNALTDAGYSTVVSAPADNKSGTGSRDAPPWPVGAKGCEFESCPPNSPAIGHNVSMPQYMYVNSYPVTSVKYGVDFAQDYFGKKADLVVTGVNVGCNLGVAVYGSGTVGAAVEAASNHYPAIAFSGCTGSQIGWEDEVPLYSSLYANLSAIVVNEIVKNGPWAIPKTWLNVNFPAVSDECSSVSDFKFVLSRILPRVPIISDRDIVICDNDGDLPLERSVVHTSGCYASISVGDVNKSTSSRFEQEIVWERLKNILTCLPAIIGQDGLLVQA